MTIVPAPHVTLVSIWTVLGRDPFNSPGIKKLQQLFIMSDRADKLVPAPERCVCACVLLSLGGGQMNRYQLITSLKWSSPPHRHTMVVLGISSVFIYFLCRATHGWTSNEKVTVTERCIYGSFLIQKTGCIHRRQPEIKKHNIKCF